MKNIIWYSLLTTSLCIQSCSSSDFSEPVYDDKLSNTKWVQEYIIPKQGTIDDSFYSLPEEIKKRLEDELLSTETVDDTVMDITHTKGRYSLSFGNNDECVFEKEEVPIGTYKIRTLERMEYHYPDQYHSYTDETGNYLIEITVKADTLFVKRIHIGDGVSDEIKGYIGHYYIHHELSISEPYPCVTKSETMRLSFLRNGYNIVLNGDITLTGVMNEECNEIDFSEIGTLYLE